MTTNNALDTLDRHWAVKVVTAADRAAALQYATTVLSRLCSGEDTAPPVGAPDFVVPLAGAYVIAASEWLDFEGAAAPTAILTADRQQQRDAHIELGAERAFLLTASLPVEADEHSAVLYRALLLAGLAEVSHKQAEFRCWFRVHEPALFPDSDPMAQWDTILLRRVVELWLEVLRGTGPSGLDRAMEIVASIREERPTREVQFLEMVDDAYEARMKFYLFTLFHLTEAGTELLLFRLHGEPIRVDQRLYSHFTLARDAAGGDPRLDASFDWLFEAARRIVAQRTAQLELLPETTS
jgi:hypothetical protein